MRRKDLGEQLLNTFFAPIENTLINPVLCMCFNLFVFVRLNLSLRGRDMSVSLKEHLYKEAKEGKT